MKALEGVLPYFGFVENYCGLIFKDGHCCAEEPQPSCHKCVGNKQQTFKLKTEIWHHAIIHS